MADLTSFIALATEAIKSDGDDSDLIEQYVNSAVGIAADFCRRNLYWDQDSLTAAQSAYAATLTTLETNWDTAKTNWLPDKCWEDAIDRYFTDWSPPTLQDRINAGLLDNAWHIYIKGISDLGRVRDGIVINDQIVAAILLIVGHLYRNRQEVVAESGAVAIQLPLGAQRILEPFMAV